MNPNSEIEMGGTGNLPVPLGHWPDGTERTLAMQTAVLKSPVTSPIPSVESPLGTGHWPVPPALMTAATSKFRLNP